ncbi:MAG: hypothetical protein J6C23_06560 [Clostridia bacterium]|nr:hypothetical protein [Clostridia bacterium]
MQVQIRRVNGILKVEINGVLYDPLSFKSFRPNRQNVTEFYNAGVRLFSVLSSGVINALGVPYSRFGESWVGDNEYDFSVIDKQMDMFIECAPNGYFAPMFMVDTRPWFLEQNPDIPNSFRHLSQTAHSEKWRKDASEYLKAVITHCEEKYGDKIYGYFILGGMTTEWLAHPDKEASHPIKDEAYKKWRNDENATLPPVEKLERTGDAFLCEDELDVYDARRFHNYTVSDTLLYFASVAQSVIKHKKLLGAYFGYLLHLYNNFLYNAGHIDYERVFLSPDIDMISSPSDYHFRKIDDPSGIMVTQKTLDKHNKLYFLEFDHITHVAPTMIYEECDDTGNSYLKEIPGAKNKCKDETESLNLMWRDYIMCNANGSALWWFDMFDGWFRSEGMMNAVTKMINLRANLSKTKCKSVSEIAVFAEGESMYRARKNTTLQSEILIKNRRSLSECGAPYDIFSIGDIYTIDEQNYKLYVLLNQFDVSDKLREKIAQLQQKGVYVLWIFAPDYANNGKPSVQNVSEITGMNTVASTASHGALDGFTSGLSSPFFSIKDSNARTIATFEDSSVAIAQKDKTFYCASTFIPTLYLKQILDIVGVYRYSNENKVYTYPTQNALGVYNATDSDAVINVKENGVYVDKITDEKFVASKNILVLPKRDMKAYLLVKE